ncbi:hypothetical protein E3J85_01555 [Patescibacteria group bacterium]|nr:MAG: hypothetical protein E3J85_01555 [Patescibacteria group bacterium]
MAASGALSYTGKGWWWEYPLRWVKLLDPKLFTIVNKTVTLKPQKGRSPFLAVRFIKGGIVNALGLGNPGIEEIIKRIENTKLNLVISIAGTTYELLEMIKILNNLNNIQGIEINVSCPNIEEDITAPKFVKDTIENCYLIGEISHHPLILKVSPAQPYLEIADAVENTGIEAFAINSVPWGIYSNDKSPLEKFGGGGVSGKAAQPLTWKVVKELSQVSSIPVIGPSVWEYEDTNRLLGLGAKAVSFGSVFLHYPWRPTLFAKRYPKKQ